MWFILKDFSTLPIVQVLNSLKFEDIESLKEYWNQAVK